MTQREIHITVNDTTRLELTAGKHAAALFDAIDNNRVHLSRFLPWVRNMKTVENVQAYILQCTALYDQQKEASFVIMKGEVLVGRIGLHHINTANKTGAIGYWLAEAYQGQGIITQACIALIRFGFIELGLHRIELKAATTNTRSNAIPRQLHFTKEGILRQAEKVNGVYLDLVLYALLRDEWKE